MHNKIYTLLGIGNGLDIRKISNIRLNFQCPKYRWISGKKKKKNTVRLVNLPDIWLYIAYQFLTLQSHNRLLHRNFLIFIFFLLY